MSTAAVVIIGNEILTGKFADENGPYLTQRLRDIGVDLRRVLVVPDEIDVIAADVADCAARYDHVFTTGGVGPTHDDVTFEAIAAAFGVSLELDDSLLALLDHYGMERHEANLRMCRIPEGTELLRGELKGFPVVRVRNVFVLPGVPMLVKQKFEVVAPMIATDAVRCVRIYARDVETDVAPQISAADEAHPQVDIGSYPRWGEGETRLIVTLETREPDALGPAIADLSAVLDVVDVEGP
jgi:molybdenum cofactor synthesis domain-containing protein